MMFANQAEEIPTQTQIDGELGSKLPIIVDESTVVVLAVVGKRGVGDEYLAGTSDEVNPAGYRRGGWCEEEVRAAGAASVHVRDIRIVAVVVEFPPGPGWLQGREFYVLPLETHLKGMLAVNLRDRVGDLECRGDFIGRQEGVASESLKSVDPERRQAPVFRQL